MVYTCIMKLSNLNKTWILDLDGTLIKHNGHKLGEKLLPTAKKFLSKIPKTDFILILTGRKTKYAKDTKAFLKRNNIRYNKIMFNMPVGERILINDIKPRENMQTAICFNVKRNEGVSSVFKNCKLNLTNKS